MAETTYILSTVQRWSGPQIPRLYKKTHAKQCHYKPPSQWCVCGQAPQINFMIQFRQLQLQDVMVNLCFNVLISLSDPADLTVTTCTSSLTNPKITDAEDKDHALTLQGIVQIDNFKNTSFVSQRMFYKEQYMLFNLRHSTTQLNINNFEVAFVFTFIHKSRHSIKST